MSVIVEAVVIAEAVGKDSAGDRQKQHLTELDEKVYELLANEHVRFNKEELFRKQANHNQFRKQSEPTDGECKVKTLLPIIQVGLTLAKHRIPRPEDNRH